MSETTSTTTVPASAERGVPLEVLNTPDSGCGCGCCCCAGHDAEETPCC